MSIRRKGKGEKELKMKTVFKVLVALAMLSMLTSIIPVYAWIYPDATTAYEKFGPRAKKLLINLYADDTAEFEALKAGDIDMTDWPLSKVVYEDIVDNYPGVGTASFGPEFGIYIFDLNCNNNVNLGNPEDPTYPNPVYQNPMSDVWLRRAVAHCVDRPSYIADPSIGAGFGLEMYTTMPQAMTKYLLDIYGNTSSPWSWEYNPTAAEAILDAHGFGTFEGDYRKWDVTGEVFELKFYARSDHPGRLMMGEKLYAELDAIGIKVNFIPAVSGTTFVEVMTNKDFHIYTGGWSLGTTPDHLILWSWDWYWHPGFCYDYGGFNCPEFNDAAEGIMYANDQLEAVEYAMIAQWYQCYEVGGIPVYCVSGIKGYSKTYCGSETPYAGANWCGIGNMPGYGIDNGYTLMNMYPEGYEQAVPGGDPMTIRWGFKVPDMKQLNVVYASWLYESNVLGLMYYDALMNAAQDDPGDVYEWAVQDHKLDTYEHPTYGTCSRIKFTLRQDIFWQDGMPFTTADIMFSFVELKGILQSRGLPPQWWASNVENILSFSILDPYNFEVLLDVKSFWALNWIGGCYIIPKHIWKPIAEAEDVQGFAPDPDIIGSGPFRFDEYVEYSHVLLWANHPGSDVHGVVSPNGYYRYSPLGLSCYIESPPEYAYMHKLPYEGADITLVCEGTNRMALEVMNCALELEVNGTGYVSACSCAPLETKRLLEVSGYINMIWLGYSYLHWNGACVTKPEWGNWTLYKYIYFHTGGEGTVTLDDESPIVVGADVTIELVLKITCCLPICIDAAPSTIIWTDIEWWQFTIDEDIAGGTWYEDVSEIPEFADLATYAYKKQLPTCDLKVDMKDIGQAAKAFGSYPGHTRWSTVSDINGDYKIDMKDIGKIARQFGWKG